MKITKKAVSEVVQSVEDQEGGEIIISSPGYWSRAGAEEFHGRPATSGRRAAGRGRPRRGGHLPVAGLRPETGHVSQGGRLKPDRVQGALQTLFADDRRWKHRGRRVAGTTRRGNSGRRRRR